MKKQLLLLLGALIALPTLARDFTYTYEGKTITYTVIDEAAKTCRTKAGEEEYHRPGNYVSGELILPSYPKDGENEFTLVAIGYYAFCNCARLTSVTIPNSVTKIGDHAFDDCIGLTSVTIPNSVTKIGDYAFFECSRLTSIIIPNSVTEIGNSAFYRCRGLTSVTIPNSVTKIGGGAFCWCSKLKEIIVEADNPMYCSLAGVLFTKDMKTLVQTPDAFKEYDIPNSVTKIGGGAFCDCDGLTSIIIPNSVTEIGNSAFSDCDGLTSIIIPNSVTEIGGGAFERCSRLTSVTIPNSVTKIGYYAFCNCARLTSVTIPNSVTEIGDYAFINCTMLQELIVKSTELSVSNNILLGCDNLQKIVLAAGFEILESLDVRPQIYTQKELFDKVKEINSSLACHALPGIIGSSTSAYNSIEVSIKPESGVIIHEVKFNDKVYPSDQQTILLENLTPEQSYDIKPTYSNEYFDRLQTTLTYQTQSIFKSIELVKATQSTLTVKVNTVEDNKIKNLSVNGVRCNQNGIATVTGLTSNTSHSVQASAEYNEYTFNSDSYSFTTEKINPVIEAVISPTAITLIPSYTDEDAIINGTEFTVNGEKYDAKAQTFVNLPVNSTVEAYFRVSSESDSKTFSLPALELKTLAARATSKDCAIICAETNMSEEEYGGGFEWRRYDAPDMVPSTFVPCPVANGHLEGRLQGLSSSTYYKYRPYYEDCNGYRTFGEWTAFITADVDVYFEPTVYTYTPNSVTKNSAKIVGYAIGGSEEINEQGFEYWSVTGSRADIEVKKVLASGQRMIVNLTDLEPSTTYKVRAFATTASKTTYGAEQEFTTAEDPDAGIEETVTEVNETELFDIYTLNGVCVRRQTNDFSGLQRGIYIANGRKIFVR